MRTLHKQHFCRSAGALSRVGGRAAATVKEELAKAAEGGSGGGEGPPWALAAMAAEELAQATRRWR
eukprot:7194429-Prymnesium_polylepis.1